MKKNLFLPLLILVFLSVISDGAADPPQIFQFHQIKKGKAYYCTALGSPDAGNPYCREIKGADIKSFKSGVGFLSTDKNSVFFVDKEIMGADPASFQFIENDYAKDVNHVYYNTYFNITIQNGSVLSFEEGTFFAISGADPDSFETLDRFYSKDSQNVYFTGRRIAGAHVESFRVLSGFMAKDNKSIFCKTRPIRGADVDSFEATDTAGYFRDKKSLYYNCDKLGGDTILSNGYSKKGDKIFYLRRELPAATDTFQINEFTNARKDFCAYKFVDAWDANACYFKGVIRFSRKE